MSLRRWVILLVVASVGLIAGCGSNNKGKIEGKWKVVSMPGDDAGLFTGDKAFFYFEFLNNGTVNLGLASSDPKDGDPIVLASGQYKLQSGDNVEFSGFSDDGKKGGGMFGKSDKDRLKIKIVGDSMTITGSDGSGQLTRLK